MPRYLVSNRIAQLLCVAALLWLFGTSPTERSSNLRARTGGVPFMRTTMNSSSLVNLRRPLTRTTRRLRRGIGHRGGGPTSAS